MGLYLLKRVLWLVWVLFATASLVFLLMVVLPPGDPVKTIVPKAPPAVVKQVRQEWGFDKPAFTQYIDWMGDVAHGNFRDSYAAGKMPVSDVIKDRFPRSLSLALTAFILEMLIGLGAGLIAAVKKYSFWDTLTTVSTTLLVALPVIWLGSMLQALFGESSFLHSFMNLPPTGYAPLPEGWQYYVLPSITIAAVSAAVIAQIVRSKLRETVNSDFYKAAQAGGIHGRRLYLTYGLRHALPSIISYSAIEFGTLIGSVVITETIFGFPGVGQAITQAIDQGDTPVVMGITLVLTAIFVVLTFASDIWIATINPKIQLEGTEGEA